MFSSVLGAVKVAVRFITVSFVKSITLDQSRILLSPAKQSHGTGNEKMSFNRVLNYIRKHKNKKTVVYIDGDTVRCAPEAYWQVILLMRTAPDKVIGTYTHDVSEIDLSADFEYLKLDEG